MKARDLLDSSDKWIKGTAARNSRGEPVRPKSEEACKWCLLGAVWKCYDYPESLTVTNKLSSAMAKIKGNSSPTTYSPMVFNDREETSFEDVKRILEIADV